MAGIPGFPMRAGVGGEGFQKVEDFLKGTRLMDIRVKVSCCSDSSHKGPQIGRLKKVRIKPQSVAFWAKIGNEIVKDKIPAPVIKVFELDKHALVLYKEFVANSRVLTLEKAQELAP